MAGCRTWRWYETLGCWRWYETLGCWWIKNLNNPVSLLHRLKGHMGKCLVWLVDFERSIIMDYFLSLVLTKQNCTNMPFTSLFWYLRVMCGQVVSVPILSCQDTVCDRYMVNGLLFPDFTHTVIISGSQVPKSLESK